MAWTVLSRYRYCITVQKWVKLSRGILTEAHGSSLSNLASHKDRNVMSIEERGIWPAPIWECKHDPKHYGAKPFAVGILFKGVIMYDAMEPSEEVKQSIVKASQDVIREMWSEKDNGFYYTGCPDFMKNASPGYSTTLISQGLAYAFRYSGDEAIKKVLLNGLAPSVQKVSGFGKSYAQMILNTPYALYDMRKRGLTELPSKEKQQRNCS